MDELYEKLYDVTAECGCYEHEEYCYDREGNPTHPSDEECNE